jgi:hypothetical protein
MDQLADGLKSTTERTAFSESSENVEHVEEVPAVEEPLLLQLLERVVHGSFLVCDNGRRHCTYYFEKFLEDERVGEDRLTVGDDQPENDDSFEEVGSCEDPHGVLVAVLGPFLDDAVCEVKTHQIAELMVLISHLGCHNHQDVGKVWVCGVTKELRPVSLVGLILRIDQRYRIVHDLQQIFGHKAILRSSFLQIVHKLPERMLIIFPLFLKQIVEVLPTNAETSVHNIELRIDLETAGQIFQKLQKFLFIVRVIRLLGFGLMTGVRQNLHDGSRSGVIVIEEPNVLQGILGVKMVVVYLDELIAWKSLETSIGDTVCAQHASYVPDLLYLFAYVVQFVFSSTHNTSVMGATHHETFYVLVLAVKFGK